MVPATVLEKDVAEIPVPAHTVLLLGTPLMLGVGLTVIVYVIGEPVQPEAEGVTVIVAVIVLVPAFVAVKAEIVPDPLAPSPIAVLEFVHANVVPVTGLVKLFAGTLAPLQ